MSAQQFKVCVVGAAGGIGQPLSLLMKQSPLVSDLTLYDVVGTPGVAADLGHISTPAPVSGFLGDDIGEALSGRDVVVIPAGVPRKPGMTRDDLFNVNAGIISGLAKNCAKHCPNAAFLIISNPVNSLVPIFADVLKTAGVYNPKKLFGITTLDTVRAKTFISELKGIPLSDVNVPIVGGHSGPTIVPLLSLSGLEFTQEEIESLTHRIQFGGDEVVKAKAGAGSATLSMAFAGAEFASIVMRGLRGEQASACTYVDRQEGSTTPTQFFATEVHLGKDGVQSVVDVHNKPLSDYEQGLLKEAIAGLEGNISKAHEYTSAA